MKVEPPKIDGRKFSDIFNGLQNMLPHYSPEWKGSDEKEPGMALLKIYAFLAEKVLNRFNQAPRKNFVAFLDMLGIKLLPGQPSRVPLTFTLAKGTDKGILIPPRTQAAADKTTEHEEQLFETESNLLAIAVQLRMAVSIDPGQDAIYQPSPGFLEGTVQGLMATAYQIVSSPVAGAKDFQLDHVTDLKEGDYLLVGNGSPAEYVIVVKISGMIVTIRDRLVNGYAAATSVTKVICFSLFEGKNLQEHGLYLGHKELFNIKSTASFTIQVTHRSGTTTGLIPLKLSWEYWGEMTEEEGEDWRLFQIGDGTNGFSVDGDINLVKTVGGEIKELAINGVKNRWIRCRVVEPLNVGVSRKLPTLDNVTIIVQSSADNLQPDLAFNNDIPLDITKPFSPFGKEPRMFDNFFLAEQEVFSKKGAKITIDVEVAPRGILGSPTAIEYNDGKIRVFAVGSQGRLTEVIIDPVTGEEAQWPDHELPPGTRLAAGSRPSAMAYFLTGNQPEILEIAESVTLERTVFHQNISVFARGENGHLLERYFNGVQWQWIDHGTPKVAANYDPAPIKSSDSISVFIIGLDGILYEFNRLLENITGKWLDHDKLQGVKVVSSPGAGGYWDEYGKDNAARVKVYLKGQNGKLYEIDCKVGDNSDDSTSIDGSAAPDSLIITDSKPFVYIYNIGYGYFASVSIPLSDGNLWEFNSGESEEKKWVDYPSIGVESVTIVAAPHGYMAEQTNQGIRGFVRGSDNDLWGFSEIDKIWTSRKSPGNAKLVVDPFVLITGGQILHVFSLSSNNSLIEWDESLKIWNEYKDPKETILTPTLSWEFWNDKGWTTIKGIKDGTDHLLKNGLISFILPNNIEQTEIAGQKNYWVRARIVGGDFGKESFTLEQADPGKSATTITRLISTKNTIRPPIITSLNIGYVLETRQFPQKCLTCNNLDYIDQTDACRIADKLFSPYIELDEKDRTLYLGFEKPFAGGPIKIFLDAQELSYSEEAKPKLVWNCSGKNEWLELDALDTTEGLVKREILELIGSGDMSGQTRFGVHLNWLKGSLVEGSYGQLPVLRGIYPNTTWALQAATKKNEILGTGSGEAHQTLNFLKLPVLRGEAVRVREILTEEDKQKLLSSMGDNAILEVKDEKGAVTETWVLWNETPDFFDSQKGDRHYTLDRATGQLQFGDGEKGMMPPEDKDNIKSFSYQYGGGVKGNIRAGEIKTLKSAVAGVDKVINNVAADGGADTATLDDMLEIGPALISHRNRAVTVEDFQWLAKDASRRVVKVKCLSNTRPGTNGDLLRENGWVTVIIVPDSPEAQPMPSLELKALVQRHLEARCALNLSAVQHLHVAGPRYTEINVSVELFVTSMDSASVVEREARQRLTAFFHPLTGGSERKGWDFARNVAASDVYALLEDITGLDHLENLRLSGGEGSIGDVVQIGDNYLVAAGSQTLIIQLAKEV